MSAPGSAEERDRIRALEGSRARALLDALRPELEERRAAIEDLACREFEEGALTPDRAIAHWASLHALRALRRRIETRIRAGDSAASRLPQEP